MLIMKHLVFCRLYSTVSRLHQFHLKIRQFKVLADDHSLNIKIVFEIFENLYLNMRPVWKNVFLK